MPRSLKDLLCDDAHADAFEAMDGEDVEVLDAAPLRRILAAVQARRGVEQELLDSVAEARRAGLPWAAIGSYLGTSGEAARQRYGSLVRDS
ncbi:MAG: hypothetical protein ACT4QG_20220 [Sporichthyaceae bacterium]